LGLDDRGLELRRVVYSAVDEKYFYRLMYEAPTVYFFDRDLPQFEVLVKSFQRQPDFDTTVRNLGGWRYGPERSTLGGGAIGQPATAEEAIATTLHSWRSN
jgi:hypothetical protein